MFRPGTRLVALALAVIALAALAVGCGGGSSGGSSADRSKLTAAELADARRSQESIHLYCRAVARYLAGKREQPTPAEDSRALAGADRIIELAQQKPDAPYDQLSNMRDLVGNIAEDLEGTNCSEVLIRRLNEGLGTVPSG